MRLKVLTVALLVACTSVAAQQIARYPNELPQFRFFDASKWHSLTPSVSTISDVRQLLGKPDNATDLRHPVGAYPGDEKTDSVVFTYARIMPGWDVLIYIATSCGDKKRPALCSIDLVPRRSVPFGKVEFPPAFTKKHINAADASWDEYQDDSGLSYEVYTSKTPYGITRPGDLNRISYGKPRKRTNS